MRLAGCSKVADDMTPTTSNQTSRLARVLGGVLLLLSLLAIVASLGAPGLGWFSAAAILIVASLLVRTIGKIPVGIIFIVSMLHLVSFGPLADFRLPPELANAPALALLCLPFVVAGAALLWARAN